VEHPKSKGDRTTLAVMIALREEGYAISIPFGENIRYDLLIDDGNTIGRVQCKTGRLRAGAVLFMSVAATGTTAIPLRFGVTITGKWTISQSSAGRPTGSIWYRSTRSRPEFSERSESHLRATIR
jgi:hypothetical protein